MPRPFAFLRTPASRSLIAAAATPNRLAAASIDSDIGVGSGGHARWSAKTVLTVASWSSVSGTGRVFATVTAERWSGIRSVEGSPLTSTQ